MVTIVVLIIITIVTTVATIRTRKNVNELQQNIDRQLKDIRESKDSQIQADTQTIETLKQEHQSKDKTIQDLNNALQSKARKVAQAALAAISVQKAQAAAETRQAVAVQPSGNMQTWMTTAGISQNDWPLVLKIMGQESGFKLGVINSIGCIGLGQACPGGNKAEMLAICPDWATNGACQMKVWKIYMERRYGTWQTAVNFKYCTGSCYNPHLKVTVIKHEIWW